MEQGHWGQLIDLYTRSDGQIYCSPETREWFYSVEPSLRDSPSMILDGDLPKRDWFRSERSPLLYVWRHRATFTFDHHTDRLITFFREVMAAREGSGTYLAAMNAELGTSTN